MWLQVSSAASSYTDVLRYTDTQDTPEAAREHGGRAHASWRRRLQDERDGDGQFAVVATTSELLHAVEERTPHIRITAHLDLTGAAVKPMDFQIRVLSSVKSITACRPPLFRTTLCHMPLCHTIPQTAHHCLVLRVRVAPRGLPGPASLLHATPQTARAPCLLSMLCCAVMLGVRGAVLACKTRIAACGHVGDGGQATGPRCATCICMRRPWRSARARD